jgi:hypothetical protein
MIPVPAGVSSRGGPEAHPGEARSRALAIGVLGLLTWLLGGYQFGLWPQLFPLEHILYLEGGLPGDWYASHSAPHWVFDHALALLPASWLAPAFIALWIVGILLLWIGFACFALDLGLDPLSMLAAGVIGLRTAFAGLGSTSLIRPYLYPSSLACVSWLFAMRGALAARPVATGLLLGLTLILHPQVGLLALPIVLAVLFRVAGTRAAAFAVLTALVSGGWSLARLVHDLVWHEHISPLERFELITVVRLPHHLLYAAFHPWEYVMVGLWSLVLVASLARLRPAPAGWGAWALAIGMVCALGAAASYRGGPTSLVELQTARASDWIPFIAVLLAAAALVRRRPFAGTVVLLAIPAVASLLWIPLRPALTAGPMAGAPSQVLLAPLLLVALAVIGGHAPDGVARRVAWVPALFLVLAGVAVSGWRRPPRTGVEPAWHEIARSATRLSRPADVFLTPPDLDGFRFYSHRPIVVDFGNFAYNDLLAWRDRMIAVTGDSAVLSARPGLDVATRIELLAREYDAHVWQAQNVVRRFDARFVVVRRDRSGRAPAWARILSESGPYALYAVRADSLAIRPEQSP